MPRNYLLISLIFLTYSSTFVSFYCVPRILFYPLLFWFSALKSFLYPLAPYRLGLFSPCKLSSSYDILFLNEFEKKMFLLTSELVRLNPEDFTQIDNIWWLIIWFIFFINLNLHKTYKLIFGLNFIFCSNLESLILFYSTLHIYRLYQYGVY